MVEFKIFRSALICACFMKRLPQIPALVPFIQDTLSRVSDGAMIKDPKGVITLESRSGNGSGYAAEEVIGEPGRALSTLVEKPR